jgi:uncharacterized membrane protein
MVMTRRQLLRSIDTARVRDAIARTERQTSGEVAVSVAPLFWGNVENAARKAFQRLGMTETQLRNGVLFFVVPSRRRFVVLGDTGIHEKVGQEFWNSVAAHLAEHFRAGDFTEGLVRGIEEVGQQLAAHFPYQHGRDVNELPNEIDFGGGGAP